MDPMIREWEFYFLQEDGYENRFIVAKAFLKFWDDNSIEKLDVPGRCMLGGKIFGREGFNDGDEIFTSIIETIERIKCSDCSDTQHDLMCATTISGSKYYFYSNDYNTYMFMMFGDLIHMDELNPRPYFYLKPKLHSSNLI